MGYIESNLLSGERIVYQTKLHKIIFLGPLFFAIIVIVAAWFFAFTNYGIDYAIEIKALSCIVGFLIISPTLVKYHTSEFAVTNKRVIVKFGLISRETKETLLQRIEAMGVEQGIMGRIFNYGDIVVTGTGGTKEVFNTIANPLAFKRYVQEQADLRE